MSLFVFDETVAKVETGSAGKKVLDTGVYDVVINHVEKTVASTGTVGFNWNFTVEGAKYPNMVYNMWLVKANGDVLFDYNLVQHIMGIAGVKQLTEYEKEIETGSGKKKITAIKELENIKCKVAIQKEYDFYNGEVTEKNKIKEFFTEDGKTFAEATAGKPANRIKWFEEKLKDGYTEKKKKNKNNGMLNGGEAAEDTSSEDDEEDLI